MVLDCTGVSNKVAPERIPCVQFPGAYRKTGEVRVLLVFLYACHFVCFKIDSDRGL